MMILNGPNGPNVIVLQCYVLPSFALDSSWFIAVFAVDDWNPYPSKPYFCRILEAAIPWTRRNGNGVIEREDCWWKPSDSNGLKVGRAIASRNLSISFLFPSPSSSQLYAALPQTFEQCPMSCWFCVICSWTVRSGCVGIIAIRCGGLKFPSLLQPRMTNCMTPLTLWKGGSTISLFANFCWKF